MNQSPGKCGAQGAAQPEAARLDVAEVRERLRDQKGPALWRSLDELAGTPEFEDLLQRELPRFATEVPDLSDGVSRRRFLQLSSASLALAGLTGCTKQPREAIIPYVKQPEYIVPGRPLFFATALTHGGYGHGVLAESHTGRPTKIEGNPDHPASQGATDIFAQAAVLTLYDPERSQSLLHNGRIATWGAFFGEASAKVRAFQALGGEGVRLVTGTFTSPTLAAQVQDFLTRFPRARWHQWEPAGRHHGRMAAQAAFGRPLETRYDFSAAKVILAIDSDALTQGAGNVRYQRDFARNRRVRKGQGEMSRLYAVETIPTSTGSLADHRLPLSPSELEAFVLALAGALGVGGAGVDVLTDERARQWLPIIAADLKANAGASLVLADEHAAPAVQVLVHAINEALGNTGRTVIHTAPVEALPTGSAGQPAGSTDQTDQVVSLRELVADMNAGRVELLLMLDGVNPVYTAPADLGFVDAMQKVGMRVHHGLYEDETSAYCHWHIPAAHELESWGDARSYDGTVSVIQPLIDVLYNGKTATEVMAAAFAGRADATSYELVQNHWKTLLVGDFAGAWRKALHDGMLPATQLPPVAAAVDGGAVQQAAAAVAARVQQARSTSEGNQGKAVTLLLRPDPTVWDGSLARNPWLQELPKPLTKLTWDNALLIGPKTAQQLGVGHAETVEITFDGRKLRAAAWIQPGLAEGAANLSLGYGRTRAGRATGLGFNAYALRTSEALWALPGAEIRGLGETFAFACTQNHHALPQGRSVSGAEEIPEAGNEAERRHLVRTRTLEELRSDPDSIQREREQPKPDESLYPAHKYEGHAWGMAIDLNVCTGCSSCVIACQSENNIPVVGKDEVRRGREMHWIRVDRYYAGDMDDPRIHNQPVPCMQCENAPCEVVCPVAATVHSDEGLNDMVYNRCVGTRYCSNNCPYKVRRFNFLRYSDKSTPVLALLENPDVTVRMRGVMEKCTYCVQRIEQAKIESKVEGQPIPVGKLQTACQQACPTQAIVFGDINDPAWEVTQVKADPLSYGLLEELNTRPRTTYLAKLSNPNPALASGTERTQHGDH